MPDNIQPFLLRQLLTYEEDSGKLFWKARNDARKEWNTRFCGKEAFTTKHMHGYFTGRVLYGTYLAHRIIWAMSYDEWPHNEIDHIDGNRQNNRLTNLRAATRQENSRNRIPSPNKTSQFLGVSFRIRKSPWRAVINIDGKHKELGYYKSEVDAALAYDKAASEHYGQFARVNFPVSNKMHAGSGMYDERIKIHIGG